jgi:hypothetical protein
LIEVFNCRLPPGICQADPKNHGKKANSGGRAIAINPNQRPIPATG